MSKVSCHSQETFILACRIVGRLSVECQPPEFRSGEIQNAINK